MNLFHAYFSLRNQQAFQRLLEQYAHSRPGGSTASPSASASKSWTRPGALSVTTQTNSFDSNDVNARDRFGRTVLHLACSATDDTMALEIVRLLLLVGNASVNVNLQDEESGWTALHRALYVGNIPAA
jgi:inhibitor of Bruton tyrosine kinase